MIIKEAIIQSLEDMKELVNYTQVYDHILKQNYYDFITGKTPKSTISAQLGEFIRNNDTRVKRVKGKGGYLYYLSKHEDDLNIEESVAPTQESITHKEQVSKTYYERDLHPLLSTYLKSQSSYSKTIFHEQSAYKKDSHQKWVHPDMVAIKFIKLKSKSNQALLNVLNKEDSFKITSYELKREISNDYELKKSYFQAVSNSSWANYGYLVAFQISSNLSEEIERLNQSFGIGVIELKANPYESKVLYPARYKELDYKTIDKLCDINKPFDEFIGATEKILTASERYVKPTKKELEELCDPYFVQDSEIQAYCKKSHIPDDIEELNELPK